ncbi:FtsX-like permease family protein [uncultured Amnibacterium sp.]|uniref:FtsX-like permease family protein n=1 Tax=uncultured Amnibacterium sp. TaxID=1631851 RepID=UPI0035CBDD6D
MSARGVAARLAIRSVRAAPGRSALIAAMIALPVAGAVMGGLVQASGQATHAELVTTELGRAQARLEVRSTPDSTAVQDPVTGFLANDAGGTTSTTVRSPASALPAGTRILPVYDAAVTVRTATGLGSVQAVVGEAWDPAFTGRWTVVDGARPSRSGEVMLTKSAMTRLDARIGGSVDLLRPAARAVTVTGVIDDRVEPTGVAEVFGTAATLGTPSPGLQQTSYYLPDHAVSWPDVQRLNRLGITAFSRVVVLDPPATPELVARNEGGGSSAALTAAIIAVAVAFVLFEVVLLAGAAFAVTARQQQRSLAVVASVGGDRRALVRVVTGAGVAIGLVGGVTGVAIGLAAGSVVMAVTSNGSGTQFPGWHLPVLAIALAVAIAVLAGWLSALLPARAAARADVLAALRGARRPVAGRRRTPVVGLVLIAVGTVATLLGGGVLTTGTPGEIDPNGRGPAIALLIAGPILMQVGALLAVRLVLAGLARVATPLGVGLRLASRDVARNRGRSVPAVAAIMATVFVGIFVMCLTGASVELAARQYQWAAQVGQVPTQLRYFGDGDEATATHLSDPSDASAVMRSVLGAGDVRVIRGVPDATATFTAAQLRSKALTPVLATSCTSCDAASPYVGSLDGAGSHLFVGSAADVAAVLGRPLSSAARASLERGGAVVVHSDYLQQGAIDIGWWTRTQLSEGGAFGAAMHPTRTDRIPAVADRPSHEVPYGAFVSAATAQRLGLPTVPTVLLATPKVLPTQAQLDELSQRLGTLQDNPSGVYVTVERGPQDPTQQIGWIAALACAVIVVAAAGAAVGLARIDNRPDADTLAAVGAPPAVQRRTAFWLALIVGGTGAVVGGGLALIPAIALALPGSPLSFAPPWLPILTLALGVPVLIAVVSWAVSPAKRGLSRRTAIA